MNLNTPTIHPGPLTEADMPIPAPRSWALHRIPAGLDQQGRMIPEAAHAATGEGENYGEDSAGALTASDLWAESPPSMRACLVVVSILAALAVFA
jgi:hypothetical protein